MSSSEFKTVLFDNISGRTALAHYANETSLLGHIQKYVVAVLADK